MKELRNALTQRWGNRKIYDGLDPTRRWLGQGEIVEFSINKKTLNNIEFKINNNPLDLIWFSQLSEIFLNVERIELSSAPIIKKNGEYLFIYTMTPDEFVDYVKDKKFMVKINNDGDVARFNKEKLIEYSIYDLRDAEKKIKDLVNEGRFDEAVSFLKDCREYTLIDM